MLEKKGRNKHIDLFFFGILGGVSNNFWRIRFKWHQLSTILPPPQKILTGREAAAAALVAVGRAVAEAGGGNADLEPVV